MMKKILFAVAASSLVLPSSVSAQAATAEENLDCAIWSSVQVALIDDEKTKNGLSIAVAWFIGQYEGQTGQNIDDAMVVRANQMTDADLPALTEPCVGRFGAFGSRLIELSQRLQASGN
jgi:hypothetical protein